MIQIFSRAFKRFNIFQVRCGCTLTDMIEHRGRYIAGHYAAARPHASGCLDSLVSSTTSQIQNTHASTDASHINECVSGGR